MRVVPADQGEYGVVGQYHPHVVCMAMHVVPADQDEYGVISRYSMCGHTYYVGGGTGRPG